MNSGVGEAGYVLIVSAVRGRSGRSCPAWEERGAPRPARSELISGMTCTEHAHTADIRATPRWSASLGPRGELGWS